MKYSLIIFILIHLTYQVSGQTSMPLYGSNPIPNSIEGRDEEKSEMGEDGILRISKVSRPMLTAYLPEKGKATGKAVIICPGGGYWILAASHEGSDVAEEFARKGIAAFVLKYRLPSDATMIDKSIGPLQDAQKAIQLVRENAEEWHVNPDQIGIIGFSAGGHLASTAGTHFSESYIDNPKNTSLRPDFMILVYPVISFDPTIGHSGSAENLLGENPTEEMLEKFSNNKQVSSHTPPAFLVHAKNDPVKIENSYLFIEVLSQFDIPYATTFYELGGHGFGMVNSTSEVRWMDEVEKWLQDLF